MMNVNMSEAGLKALKKLHKRETPYDLQLSVTQSASGEKQFVTVQAKLVLLQPVQDLAGKTVQPAERSVLAYGTDLTVEAAQLKATENALFLLGVF